MFKIIVMLASFIYLSAATAQPFAPPPPPPPPPAAMPDVPPPPPGVQSGEIMEPGVTIIQTDNETIYEYRKGSQLYMVRVVPKAGPPYYFYDLNGDGELDMTPRDPRNNAVNMWEIFRF